MVNMNKAIRCSYLALFFFSVSVLQGCSLPGMLKETESTATLEQDEIIVVGKIELVPGLVEHEQVLEAPGVIDLFGAAEASKNKSHIQFNTEAVAKDVGDYISPELGKMFAFNVPANMPYLVEGFIITQIGSYGNSGKIHLPVAFKLDIKPSDKAVYIGHIKYTRDDFNSITDVELIDDYTDTEKLFRKSFGDRYKLRKSLIKPY